MGTKLRALYQRRKGRDLFDMWYVLKNDLVNVKRVIDIFKKYCAHNDVKITQEEFIKSLELKKLHRDFRGDMSILLPLNLDWKFDEAYAFVMENIIKKLP